MVVIWMISDRREGIMKRIEVFILTFVALVLVASCNTPEVEEIVEQPVRKTIPFTLNADIADTKVSYDADNNLFSFKSGDQLSVSGEGVSGLLAYAGNNRFSGNLTIEGEPAPGTELSVTLVHVDNSTQSTYAHGIAPTLKDAVENYSLFTGTFGYQTSETVALTQSAAFFKVTVKFNGVLSGSTPVEIKNNNNVVATGSAAVAPDQNNSSMSIAEFVAIIPGSTELVAGNSWIVVCERNVALIKENKQNKTLSPNTYYTVTREEVPFTPQNGDPFWSDGTFGRYRHDNGASIIGIIVYVNDGSQEGQVVTENRTALVMALKNIATPGGYPWSAAEKGPFVTPLVTTPNDIIDSQHFSGFNNTTTILQNYGEGVESTAVYRAVHYSDYYPEANIPATTTNTTGWFLPSIGQWLYSISEDGFGGADPVNEWNRNLDTQNNNWLQYGNLNDLVRVMPAASSSDNALVKSLNDRLADLQADFSIEYNSFAINENYWSSSESIDDNNDAAIRINFGTVELDKDGNYWSTIKAKPFRKKGTNPWQNYYMMIRPFLAFTSINNSNQ